MKKVIFLFIALVSFALASKAQDIVTLTNGTQIQAKVLAINPDNIQYKDFNNLDGPTITVRKDGVMMIVYANGTKTVFNDAGTKSTAPAAGFQRSSGGSGSHNHNQGYGYKKKSERSSRLHGWYLGANLLYGVSNATTSDQSYSTSSSDYSGINFSATRVFNQHLALQFGLGDEGYSYNLNFNPPAVSPGGYLNDNFSLNCITVPVRAVYFSNSKRRAGLYVAAGFDFSLVLSAYDQEGDGVAGYYKPVMFSPYLSTGVAFRNRDASAFWMFGLFYKTTVSNIYAGNSNIAELNSGNSGAFSSYGLTATFMRKYFRDKGEKDRGME